MRSLPAFSLSLACLATLCGCAIIVAPHDGEGQVQVKTPFSSETVVGDGRLASERRPAASLAGLVGLELSGPVQVDVRVGPAPSLAVEADSNLLPLIRTEASGNSLRIWVEGNVRSANPMRVTYTAPQLTQIRATGSGRLLVSELNGAPLSLVKTGSGATQLSGRVDSLDIESNGSGHVNASALQSGNARLNLNGSGRVSLGQLRADTVSVNVSGSGELQASGAARSLTAQVHGSGGANLAGLASEQAELRVTGSGDISAMARQSLVAQASGSGRITVYGNPAQRKVSGKHVQVLN